MSLFHIAFFFALLISGPVTFSAEISPAINCEPADMMGSVSKMQEARNALVRAARESKLAADQRTLTSLQASVAVYGVSSTYNETAIDLALHAIRWVKYQDSNSFQQLQESFSEKQCNFANAESLAKYAILLIGRADKL